MKKKLIIISAALLLMVSGAVNAAITTGTGTIGPDTMSLVGEINNETYSWTHVWDFDPTSLASFSLVSVDSATLDVYAKNIYPGKPTTHTDVPVSLGNLSTNNSAVHTVYTLDSASLTALSSESATFSVTAGSGQYIDMRTSTLTIDYTYQYDDGTTEPDPEPEPNPDPVIPAPGAILLGSLGVGLVGFLRRRRTL